MQCMKINQNLLGEGGAEQKRTFRGGCMDIFWDCTMQKLCTRLHHVFGPSSQPGYCLWETLVRTSEKWHPVPISRIALNSTDKRLLTVQHAVQALPRTQARPKRFPCVRVMIWE